MAPAALSAGRFPRAAAELRAGAGSVGHCRVQLRPAQRLHRPRCRHHEPSRSRSRPGSGPALGIFPNISWELWERERGELPRLLVGSGCPWLSPCVCAVLGVVWVRPMTRSIILPFPQVALVMEGDTARPSPVHPGWAGSWDGSEGREGGKPSRGDAGQD